MCVNFQSPTKGEFQQYFAVDCPSEMDSLEIWQDYCAPIILNDDDDQRIAVSASFGLVPQHHKPIGVKHLSTMNARAETISSLRNYKPFWQACQLCLVPAKYIYEPCYASGTAMRWQIGMADGQPFAIAGLWRTWSGRGGVVECAFTQITINADTHPLMSRFHKPLDEKRMVAIIAPSDYEAWLRCRNPAVAATFLKPYPAEWMTAQASPLKRR
ncbi:putative SOS response-associated peptidase YedK [Chitinivorax tropicus]|uniref:Abasic site processing protein n=1 Tax=Chitinivorax tropicus TaxID=714531 RepID=A0A840MNC2_9PROT|nr:SOS response-associated peptidase family protein [Chitinivorax tropicus]MBB5016741.1 putative SOS response-associated peptidase YedK [Chitinivorax tropicus]